MNIFLSIAKTDSYLYTIFLNNSKMHTIIDYLKDPWPWYISGPAITAIMLFLLYNGKSFGFSSNLRNLCSLAGADKLSSFFSVNWKDQRWNLLFLLGSVIGGFISSAYLQASGPMELSGETQAALAKLSIRFDGNFLPGDIFGAKALMSIRNWIILLAGGFLVGFGSRYAGGCTSGHAISGLSNLQYRSLIAVTGFFIGGLIMTHLLYPLIF